MNLKVRLKNPVFIAQIILRFINVDLNILTFIPSLVCTIFNVAIAYGATYYGLMGRTCMSVPWTLPAPLYAFLSTMDWKAIIVWLFLFVVNVLIFLPFMLSYDKQLDLEDSSNKE